MFPPPHSLGLEDREYPTALWAWRQDLETRLLLEETQEEISYLDEHSAFSANQVDQEENLFFRLERLRARLRQECLIGDLRSYDRY